MAFNCYSYSSPVIWSDLLPMHKGIKSSCANGGSLGIRKLYLGQELSISFKAVA